MSDEEDFDQVCGQKLFIHSYCIVRRLYWLVMNAIFHYYYYYWSLQDGYEAILSDEEVIPFILKCNLPKGDTSVAGCSKAKAGSLTPGLTLCCLYW